MKPRDFFNAKVSDEIQEEIVRTFYRAYPDTRDDLVERDYPLDYRQDVYGQLLRVKVDMYLRQLSKRFPEQIKARTDPNNANNSHHALIISDKVVMTASAVQHETDVPREAIFRACLAALTQVEFEFDEATNSFIIPNPKPDPEYPQLYAVILHGSAGDNRYLPGFIKVAFLDRKMNRLCADIDLSVKYRDLVDEMLVTDTEKIPDKTTVVPNKEISSKQGTLL